MHLKMAQPWLLERVLAPERLLLERPTASGSLDLDSKPSGGFLKARLSRNGK